MMTGGDGGGGHGIAQTRSGGRIRGGIGWVEALLFHEGIQSRQIGRKEVRHGAVDGEADRGGLVPGPFSGGPAFDRGGIDRVRFGIVAGPGIIHGRKGDAHLPGKNGRAGSNTVHVVRADLLDDIQPIAGEARNIGVVLGNRTCP